MAFLQLQPRQQTVFTVHSMPVGMAKTNTLMSYASTQFASTSRGSIEEDGLFTASIVGMDPTQTRGTGFHLIHWSTATEHTRPVQKAAPRSLCRRRTRPLAHKLTSKSDATAPPGCTVPCFSFSSRRGSANSYFLMLTLSANSTLARLVTLCR